MAYDRTENALVSGPDIISRGFIYVRENEDIIDQARDIVRAIVYSYGRIESADWPQIKNRIKEEIHRFIYEKMKRLMYLALCSTKAFNIQFSARYQTEIQRLKASDKKCFSQWKKPIRSLPAHDR